MNQHRPKARRSKPKMTTRIGSPGAYFFGLTVPDLEKGRAHIFSDLINQVRKAVTEMDKTGFGLIVHRSDTIFLLWRADSTRESRKLSVRSADQRDPQE